MPDYIDNYDFEETRNDVMGGSLLREDRKNLQKAITECVEIFSAPGKVIANDAFGVIEILDELCLCFSDNEVADQVGEIIEILNEIYDEKTLAVEDAQRGKKMVQNLAQCWGLDLPHSDV